MGVTYTEDQLKVIQLHNRNILVSAAAGSGKTAVLVERIIQMICNEEKPVDIDRLLVLTFTNAAAAEMRERISVAIAKKLEELPFNQHLQKQATLIHNAQITTIHKFCLFIIHNNFNDIGLDPGFRVSDEGEMKLLSQDVLQQYLEEKFEENSEEFLECVEVYSGSSKETRLEEFISELYKFAMSYPFPIQWLEERKQDYQIESLEDLEKQPFILFAMDQINILLEDAGNYLKEAEKICMEADGPYMYGETLESDRKLLEELSNLSKFSKGFELFSKVNFTRLPSKKDDSVSPEKRELAKSLRDMVKESVKKIKEVYFYVEAQQQLEHIQASKTVATTLLDLVIGYKARLDLKKREKGIIDFNDMEHFALEILIDEKTMKPTKTAEDYQQFFHEILVDEYQDSNLVQEYLLKSIAKEDMGIYNRFMVGDVKQSIYKFRLARPEIFMEKFDRYEKKDSLEQRIDLRKNFRSRSQVIDSINFIFKQIMAKDLGKVEYNDDAALYLGAQYPEAEENQTELLLLDLQDAKEDKKEAEARLIAKRIKELNGKFLITDKETKELRPANYSDMVILLRTNTGWDEVFSKILIEEGIPCYVTSKTGYFATTEISTIMHFLRILDNPLQDIPLFGVLHSIVGKFTEEELAKINIEATEEYYLYDRLIHYRDKGNEPYLIEKIQEFIRLIEEFRTLTMYTPIHKLIQLFMEKTGYYFIHSALPGGEQRQANLDMLMEKALSFESTSYYGLFHFIRYIEQNEKAEIEHGEASILDENADVVRIMSIHKSKGLEFPVCFVAGIHKEFNRRDTTSPVIVDVDMGLGTISVDLKKRTQTTTLRKTVLANKMQLDNIGEEIRVLYVALTRAKEKLILTGVVKNLAKEVAKYGFLQGRDKEILPYDLRSQSSSYLDFILPALTRNRCFNELFQEYQIEQNKENLLYLAGPEMKVRVFTTEDIMKAQITEQVRKELLKERLRLESTEVRKQNPVYKKIAERFSYEYQFENLKELYIKTTVSELKKKSHKEVGEQTVELFPVEEIIPYIPKFINQKETITGTARGSAYHKVMELLDLSQEKTLENNLSELVESGKLTKEYCEVIALSKIEEFLNSELAKRMKDAEKNEKLFREQPFVLGVKASEIDQKFPETETILVQGVIDLYFEEDGELVVADYKTDRVDTKEELINRYKTQLDYYGKALEQLTGKKVKEKRIYSFALGTDFSL